MAEFGISPGQLVAVFWDKSSPEEALKKLVDSLQGLTGSEGQIFTENISQLLQCKCLPTILFSGWEEFSMEVLFVCSSWYLSFVWGHHIFFTHLVMLLLISACSFLWWLFLFLKGSFFTLFPVLLRLVRYGTEQNLNTLLLVSGASYLLCRLIPWGNTVSSVGGLWEGWEMIPG